MCQDYTNNGSGKDQASSLQLVCHQNFGGEKRLTGIRHARTVGFESELTKHIGQLCSVFIDLWPNDSTMTHR
jgi:hypothetical protein